MERKLKDLKMVREQKQTAGKILGPRRSPKFRVSNQFFLENFTSGLHFFCPSTRSLSPTAKMIEQRFAQISFVILKNVKLKAVMTPKNKISPQRSRD
jgi:hypothetical protein